MINIMGLSGLQIAFIILVPIVVILGIVFLLYLPIKIHNNKKHYKEYYYKKIYSIAVDKDYYLINNFKFKLQSNKIATLDHILFEDKFFYIIQDYYLEGQIFGNEDDINFIVSDKEGKKYYDINVISDGKDLTHKLCMLTTLDESLFVNICLFNNKCDMKLNVNSDNVAVCTRKELAGIIKKFESKNIGRLKPNEVENAVHSLHKINIRDE